jgi:hypothetical protein
MGTLVPSQYFVGGNVPPIWMANQMLPAGQALELLKNYIRSLHANDQGPLTDYHGQKTLAFIPVRYHRPEPDTLYRTFEYLHLPTPWNPDLVVAPYTASEWLSIFFGHSPFQTFDTSHVPQDQTLEDWYLTATNGQVHFVPNTSRWPNHEFAPGCAGLLCNVDANGYAIPWQLPYTRHYCLNVFGWGRYWK